MLEEFQLRGLIIRISDTGNVKKMTPCCKSKQEQKTHTWNSEHSICF